MHKLLVISEIHGSAQNIDVYKHFIQQWQGENIIFKIGLEIGDTLSLKDGKISFEMVDFLSWLEKENIQSFSFDTYESKVMDWNARDETMAKNITKELEHASVIAIMGNLHAQRKSFYIRDKEHIPVLCHINNKTHIVGIGYQKGSYFNFGKQHFTKPFIPNSQDVDEVYLVPFSHPVTPLISS